MPTLPVTYREMVSGEARGSAASETWEDSGDILLISPFLAQAARTDQWLAGLDAAAMAAPESIHAALSGRAGRQLCTLPPELLRKFGTVTISDISGRDTSIGITRLP